MHGLYASRHSHINRAATPYRAAHHASFGNANRHTKSGPHRQPSCD